MDADPREDTVAGRPEAGSPEEIGGDPVCWAQFVCAECGAMTTEGHHREGCPAAPTDS